MAELTQQFSPATVQQMSEKTSRRLIVRATVAVLVTCIGVILLVDSSIAINPPCRDIHRIASLSDLPPVAAKRLHDGSRFSRLNLQSAKRGCSLERNVLSGAPPNTAVCERVIHFNNLLISIKELGPDGATRSTRDLIAMAEGDPGSGFYVQYAWLSAEELLIYGWGEVARADGLTLRFRDTCLVYSLNSDTLYAVKACEY